MSERGLVGSRLLEARIVAVIRHERTEDALAIAEACLAGGLRVIELTLTTPDATGLIAELSAAHDDALVGAGTVVRPEEAEAAVAAGARFLVSPVTDLDVLAAGRAAQVLTIPGAFTPSEIAVAHRHGAHLVKLFPAGSVGPAFAGAVRSVLPDVRLVPTGGVAEGDVAAWFAAGAGAVGIGSQLSRVHASGGTAEVTALARRLARHSTRPCVTAGTAPDRSTT